MRQDPVEPAPFSEPATGPLAEPIAEPSAEKDRQDLEQIKEAVRSRLRQHRAVSEEIWDLAHDLCEADRRGLWQKEMLDGSTAPRPQKKSNRGRKRSQPTREEWASRTFRITERQARKYFNTGEGTRREEVAGTGLCLDRMAQFGLSAKEVRDVIRDLGIEGLSARALSAGRRAALPWLEEQDIAGARIEAERVARRFDRQEQREDMGVVRRTLDDEAGSGPSADLAFKLASGALTQVEGLKTVPLDELDVGPLNLLVDVSERLALGAREVRDRAGGTVGPDAPAGPPVNSRKETSENSPPAHSPPPVPVNSRKETSENSAAAPVNSRKETSENSDPAAGYARPAPGTKLSFGPMLKAIGALDPRQNEAVVLALYRAVAGNPIEEVRDMLAVACQHLVRAGVPRDLVASWGALLTDEDRERRGRFAMWFGRKMGDLSLAFHLTRLSACELPAALRAEVAAYLEEFPCAGDGAGGRRRTHVTTKPGSPPETQPAG